MRKFLNKKKKRKNKKNVLTFCGHWPTKKLLNYSR